MATYQIPPPSPMVCKGNTEANWKAFKEAYEDYATATELTEKDAKIQVATLKSLMGQNCKTILTGLKLTDEKMKDPSEILTALENHFVTKHNILYERYVFYTATQQPNESVEQFVDRLRQLASNCDFGAVEDDMLRDRLVLGCRDEAARARLFRKEEACTLKTAMDSLRVSEQTSQQLRSMTGESVNFKKTTRARGKPQKKKQESQRAPQKKPNQPQYRKKPCIYCGGHHKRKKESCPAYGETCRGCGSKNHFRAVCMNERSKRVNLADEVAEPQTAHEEDTTDSSFMMETLGAVTLDSNKKKIFVKLQIQDDAGEEETAVRCQVDTGTESNIMSHKQLCEIDQTGNPAMTPSITKLRLYNEELMTVMGERVLTCRHDDKEWQLNFKIVEAKQPPLLSTETSLQMGLIHLGESVNRVQLQQPQTEKPEEIIAEYKQVFEGLGCLPGKYHIDVDETVKPVQHTPRRVPVPLKEKLKSKIEELVQQGIIVKEDGPTDWISSIVTILKPGKLRVCLDPRDLNKAIKRPKIQMPTLDEVLPNLAKAKMFTVLDAKDGFHQVELDEESSKLTTFWTPFGRYRYLRMPFGISSAPEEWQRRLNEAMIGLPGVICIADDILVYGAGDTEEEVLADHNRNLRQLLQRAAEINLKLNRKKLKLCQTEVSYMGQLLTSDGIKPDPSKVAAIIEMKPPQDKKGVQSVLGCVNYLSRYLPKLAEVCEPLRRLTEKDAVFVWESQQEEAFASVKKLLTEAPLLKYYDVTKDATIQCDASEKGLGATLLQDNHPVAYASRSLTQAERNYAQIEKEALAIVFACERFNQYLHGREETKVQSDHKPLIPIFKKPIHRAPKRLQRMLLRLQKYNLTVEYRPGAQMYIADWLSRSYLENRSKTSVPAYQIFQMKTEDKLFQEIEQINAIDYIKVTDDTSQQLQRETRMDPVLQTLKTTVLSGWPESRSEVPESIREYYGYRDEISVQNGILYKGMKVIVPTSMHQQMLEKIHSSHLGVKACLRRAKDVLYWPGMAAQIKAKVEQCTTCQSFQVKQQKEPMMTHEIPTRPWSIVSQDLFHYERRDFLITVDHYSDYWEMDEVTGNTTAANIVECTKAHFARHGRVNRVISDNGPQWVSQEFADFAREWEFEHTTSSPYHSQGNGKAEATVKIAKSLLKKTLRENSDLYAALLDWRNTPDENGQSPVQKLMSRRTQTLLPTPESLLQPKVVENVTEAIKIKRQKAKSQYDKSAKVLPELLVGETVRVQPDYPKKQWQKATCMKQVGPRSYLVKTQDGQTYRRNRKFLRTTKELEETTSTEKQRETNLPEVEKQPVQQNNQEKSPTKQQQPRHQDKKDPTAAQVKPPETAVKVKAQHQDSTTVKQPPVQDKTTAKSTRTRTIKKPAKYKDFVMN